VDFIAEFTAICIIIDLGMQLAEALIYNRDCERVIYIEGADVESKHL